MNLDKLSIFSKDTDATEALRGYEYQKLRTLESWLENYLLKNNVVLYCDYEEDIFQRNLDSWESKFTQLKLYSSKNFSFSSVEVTKAISHFFMLFVKGEYKFDTVQFVFETNANVARAYGNNDAGLLQRWKDNQGNLDDGLLRECAAKIKAIVTAYASGAVHGTADESLLEKIKDANQELNTLPDQVWEDFAKTIRWNFSDSAADAAIESVIASINDKIVQTGFPAAHARKESVLSRLYYAVSEKSIQEDPDQRRLDNALLDHLLLDSGDEADKGYNEEYGLWSEVDDITYFRASEFYQVIGLANYCRHSDYLKHHAAKLTILLKKYIALEETPLRNKQKAIYELLWLSLRVKMLEEPNGTLQGHEDYIRLYFDHIAAFKDHEALEDAVALIGIVQGAVVFQKADIQPHEIEAWRKQLLEMALEGINTAKDANQACYFHEIAAELLLHNATNPDNPAVMDEAFVHFDAILEILEQATVYNVTQLHKRINAFIKILVHINHDISEIERLEDFADKLMPFAARKVSDHDMAKIYVSRGAKYLKSKEPLSVLRALNLFHKAKSLWRHDHTKEGYILALLNIAQLYAGIGSNLAAKYYALSAARHATEKEELHKRISDAFALVFHADFKQGAWISCLEDFRMYFTSRAEFKTTDLDNDKMVLQSFSEFGTVLALMPRISPQLYGLIEYEKIKLNGLYKEFIADYENYINEHILDQQLPELIRNKLDDSPLSDLGPQRVISWQALGTDWKIKFANNWMMNSIGEEFAAILQILVAEFGLTKLDMHLLKSKVEIDLEIADQWHTPVRLPSNEVHKWKIYIPAVIEEDYTQIKMQPASVLTSLKYIMDEISLLPKEELFAEVQSKFEKDDLAGKTMPDFLYQRLYRYLISEQNFNETQRDNFASIPDQFETPGFSPLQWQDGQSQKYTIEKSLELIRGRYKSGLKVIHLTLAAIKEDPRYQEFINTLRNQGWLDWQITRAIVNHVLSYKLNIEMSGKTFSSEQDEQQTLRDTLYKIARIDESENYVPLALDYFLGEEFQFQLKQVAHLVLKNWGLESKSEYPDFESIQEFLTLRFNYGNDDDRDLSPL